MTTRSLTLTYTPESHPILLTLLPKGTIHSIEERTPRVQSPFAKFGRATGCTAYITVYDAEGLEVELADGSHPRTYCEKHRMKTANGFLCEGHTKEVFPMGRPKGWNPIVGNQLDARALIAHDASLLKGRKIKSTRLLTDDRSIRLHDVGYLKTVETA